MSLIQTFVKTSGVGWEQSGYIQSPGNNVTGGPYGSWPDAMAVAEDGTIVTSYLTNDNLFVHLDGDATYTPSQTLDSGAGFAIGIGANVIVGQGPEGQAQVWAREDISGGSDFPAWGPWEFVELIGGNYFENNGVFVSSDDQTVILSHATEQGPIEVFRADGTGEFNSEQTITPDRAEPVSPLLKWKFMNAGGYRLILCTMYRDPSAEDREYPYSDPVAFIYSQQPPAPDTMVWWKSLIYASQTTGPAPEVTPDPGPDPEPPGPDPDLPVAPSLPAWVNTGATRGSLVNLSVVNAGLVPSLANVTGSYGQVMYTNGQGMGGLLVCTWNSTGELVSVSSEENNEFYEFQYQPGDILVPMVWEPGFNNWEDIDTYPTIRVDSIQPSSTPLDSLWQPYSLGIVTDGILPAGAVDGTYNIPVLPAAGQQGTGALYRATVSGGQFTQQVPQIIDGFAPFDQGYLTGELYELDVTAIPGVTSGESQYVQVLGMYLLEDDEGGGGDDD